MDYSLEEQCEQERRNREMHVYPSCAEIREKDRIEREKDKQKLMSEFKLCFIDPWSEMFAYFTTAHLKDQWADDWNDKPWEHNAGEPYEWHGERNCGKYEIFKVAFESQLVLPNYGHTNSPYSVEEINKGDVPWLRSADWDNSNIEIMAGATIDEFVKKIEASGGSVYFKK